LLSQYLKKWGPLKWQGMLAEARPLPNPELAQTLLYAGAVEADATVIYAKLRAANVARRKPIEDFSIAWLAEEVEHGRALAQLALLLGADSLPPTRGDRRSIRAALAWPALALTRPFAPYLEATYMSLGTAAEFFALTTYRECARRVDDQNARRMLLAIAAQEGRHLRFYRNAATILLRRAPAAAVTASLLRLLWRPPGVDPLGIDRWLETFKPLFASSECLEQMLQLDRVMQGLPGMQNLVIMRSFLTRYGIV
jgi:rubrerythrin